MTSPTRTGRPAATTHQAIAEVALDLFLARGYDETSMADVARAAGIGRSTLFTYFSSKGNIVFDQYEEAAVAFQVALANQPIERGLAQAAFAACDEVFSAVARERPMTRIIAVVCRYPDATGKWRAFDRWAHYVAAFVAARRGGEATDLENAAIGLAIWSMMWTALEHWSASGDPLPSASLARTLRVLERTTAAPPPAIGVRTAGS